MKEGDQSSVYLESGFKPPDRSTSAPPVLSLHSESLFAFRAAEHLQLFSDIRCEDNYYEFYYQNQGGKGLPPPLENQSFLHDRSYVDEDEHNLLNTNPHPNNSHQQQIQQLQQQIQQQKQQIQQQQALQNLHQQYIQQQIQLSPHHTSHPQHLQQQQQQHQPQQQQQQHPQQYIRSQHPHAHLHPMQPIPQQIPHHLPQQLPFSNHQHQIHQQDLQMQHQPHPRYERAQSVPDALNPILRSNSNPSYMRAVREEPARLSEDDITDSPAGIWGVPFSRGMSGDYLRSEGDGAHNKLQQGRHPAAHNIHHLTPPPQQQVVRDPNNYYNNQDYDNVAYATANSALKDDLGSIWERTAPAQQSKGIGYDTRHQHPQQSVQHNRKSSAQHLPAPTPVPSVGALMDLLGTGFSGNNPNMTRKRSQSGPLVPPPTVSPPLISGSSSTSPPALTVCRYFAQGFCSRGDKCTFLHDEQQQLNTYQQDRAGDQFPIAKPKAQSLKKVASPPPIAISNREPSPVGGSIRLAHMTNGNGHQNGISNSQNMALNNMINSFSNGMNLSGSSGGSGGMSPNNLLDTFGNGDTSPQPRSTTPNGLGDVFANGGSTSPNSKSDLSRQYTSIEQVIGHIYSLCKDQHGCRFLQKKLEDRDSMIVEIIFNEVYDHMTELMIDPFGNYLCQKLLEHCNDDQRLVIIEKVAPDLVKISKNMHGTRAVQKMIEYLTTPEQIAIAKKALSNHVVTLIQDLNGNHVIQRCLNRLSPQDNQFIYDSVSQAGHCVEVATHRHGCCVLQRCIDHASDSQKIQLINEIIANALVLVQDPYGNYVVQYVLDLPFPGLASRLARRFLGHIPILSTQKFSSNVVEKVIMCLNVTDVQTRAAIIQELVEYDNLLYLLQDPYANYVIQTSLNVSEPVQHTRLVEAIRPHLTSLRNTPYGKRIQNKILKESSRDYYA